MKFKPICVLRRLGSGAVAGGGGGGGRGGASPPIVVTRRKIVNRDLTILGRQRDGNGYQYNRSLKRIE